jgi:hypothetical protein
VDGGGRAAPVRPSWLAECGGSVTPVADACAHHDGGGSPTLVPSLPNGWGELLTRAGELLGPMHVPGYREGLLSPGSATGAGARGQTGCPIRICQPSGRLYTRRVCTSTTMGSATRRPTPDFADRRVG